MPSSTEELSLLDIETIVTNASMELNEIQGWPRATNMFSWWGSTRSDDGERKFTHIGMGLWLGTDGRLWFLYSRNWMMQATAVLTDREARALRSSIYSGRTYMPYGLTSSDLTETVLLSSWLSTDKRRREFILKLEAKTAKLKAKKK